MTQNQTVYTRQGAKAVDQASAVAAQAQADQAKAAAAMAQVDVERARALAGEEVRQKATETRRLEKAQDAREAKVRSEQRAADRARRRAERAARRAARRVWLVQRQALLLTLVVIGASMAIAWPAQATYFVDSGMGLMGLVVPVVVEGPQWLSAALTARAVGTGTRAWPFQLATLLFAAVAAGINYSHGSLHSPLLGVIYALASLTGMVAWELYVLSAKSHSSGRTVADRRRDVGRRISFRTEWRYAVKLRRAITGLGSEAAWEMAWRLLHGAAPGITADLLAWQNQALIALAEASGAPVAVPQDTDPVTRSEEVFRAACERMAERGFVFVDAFFEPVSAAHIVGADGRTAQDSAPETPDAQGVAKAQFERRNPPPIGGDRKPRRAPASKGARKAAARTARAAQADPQELAQQRAACVARYDELKGTGAFTTWRDLADEFGRSEAWARAAVDRRDKKTPGEVAA